MKKHFLNFLTSTFVALLFFSCSSSEFELTENFEPFIILAPGNMPVEKLPTDVIEGIHNDLLKKERNSDAANFLKTYDLNTGLLVPSAREKYNRLIEANNDKNQTANNGRVNDFIFYNTAHVQSLGWLDYPSSLIPAGGYYNSGIIGTTGQAKRLEAFTLSFSADIGTCCFTSISYQAHVQSIGWQDWKSNGAIAGTTGQAKRIEAIRISTDDASYLRYRAHCQSLGWLGWVDSGNIAGTIGQSLRLEAFQYEVYLYP